MLASGCAARLGPASPRGAAQGSVRVLTLNLAHGRALAWTQTRARPRHWYRGNLDVVAELLEREAPTILALQEAELAASTAQRIMLKYNLDLQRDEAAAATECAYLWLGEPTGRVQPHQRALAMLLLEHFFVQVIWIRVYRPAEAKHGSVLEVCGRPENLAMAEYVHQFVSRTVERLWREHKRAANLRSDRDRRSFLAGAVEGLSDKLQAQRDDAKREGLVWFGDAAVRDYYRRRHPRIVSTGGSSSGSHTAYTEGKSAGKTIVLSRPVHGDSTPSTPRALTSGK